MLLSFVETLSVTDINISISVSTICIVYAHIYTYALYSK